MNQRILLVEDEDELCLTLGDRLRSEGYIVETAADGDAGLAKAAQLPFDLIILDIMLPYRSGLDVCTEIRRAGLMTPIILLTARSQTVEKVVGLKLGADDYVTKPFDTFELMARIEALMRRVLLRRESRWPGASPYRFGSVHLDVRTARVTRDDETIKLTAREYGLLCYFAEHRGAVLSRDVLLREVWGHRPGTNTRTVDMHVASLRQKLELSPKNPELIITVPGMGYRFLE